MEIDLKYFSHEELLLLKQALKKTIRKILAYEWVNDLAGTSGGFIDKLEFLFDDFSKLILSCHDSEKRIQVYSNYDSDQHNEALKHQFKGKIRVNTIDAGEYDLWKDVLGKKLNSFDFTINENGVVAEKLIFIFESEKRIIELGAHDGLSIDYHEE